MPEPTAQIPLCACVAIDDWDAVLRAVQVAFSLDAHDRPAAPPTLRGTSDPDASVWLQGEGQGTPAAQGAGDE